MRMFSQGRKTGLHAAAICATALAMWVPLHAAEGGSSLRNYVTAERTRAPAPSLPRSAFLQRASNTEVRLSPDGMRVAWLHEASQRRELWMRDTAGGAARRLLLNTSAGSLAWTQESRWLLLVSPREVFAVAAAGQAGGGLVATLGGIERRELLGVDASQPAAVLLLERASSEGPLANRSWRLLRATVGGASELLWKDPQRITGAAFDAKGGLVWLQSVEDTQLVIHRVVDGRLQAVRHCMPLQRCALLGSAADGGVWMRSDLDGDRSRIVKLDASGRLHTLHEDPQRIADLAGVVLDPVTQRPRFASYRSSTPATWALDAGDAVHLAAIRRALPGRDLDLQPGSRGRWLVRESASSLHGQRWHLYDPRTQVLSFFLDEAPLDRRSGQPAVPLPESTTSRALPVSWRASDGLLLHGFLWLPPGRDSAHLPLVVNAHGGPWSHVVPQFHYLPQLLANRGYAVFEPNFRASTGYGRSYALAAAGDFGNGRVQQDIVEGTRWLLAQGIGDAARVGIVGASFGGYCALLGITFQPELFQVGVALAPPPDFAWTLQWMLRNPESLEIGKPIPMRDWLRVVSLDPDDAPRMARLRAESPLAHAARIDRPLLLVAGGADQRVGIAGVVEYAARLKLAGKDVSLLVDDEAGHSDGDALGREGWVFAMEGMLHAHLGGAAPPAPDAELRNYLQRNLRLRGGDLSAALR
jgi:dienelactone hydrolase